MKRTNLTSIALMVMLVLVLAAVTGCSSGKSNANISAKPVVAVSIVPQKTFVEAVCADLVEVVVMVPPGYSPENYEPTPREREKFSKAEIYFAIGVPVEEVSILPAAAELEKLKTVRLHEEVARVYADRELAPGERDPHIWLSPKRVKIMIEVIAREMSLLDPQNKGLYEANAEKFMVELDAVDSQIKQALNGVKNRKFIVFHPAFGYLADDYALEMYALEEEGKEATPQRLIEMIELARKENIKAIFYQAEMSGKQAESFAEAIGGKAIQLAPLAPDYIDNLKNMAALMAEVMQ